MSKIVGIKIDTKSPNTKEKIYYYRQLQVPRLPNDQQYVTGGWVIFIML